MKGLAPPVERDTPVCRPHAMASRKSKGDSGKAKPATAEEVATSLRALADPYALTTSACSAQGAWCVGCLR